MSMEWQVTDLETSKKLRTLGVRQDKSNFYWTKHGLDCKSIIDECGNWDSEKNVPLYESYAAFTLAEIIEISRITNLHDFDLKSLVNYLILMIEKEDFSIKEINERLGEL